MKWREWLFSFSMQTIVLLLNVVNCKVSDPLNMSACLVYSLFVVCVGRMLVQWYKHKIYWRHVSHCQVGSGEVFSIPLEEDFSSNKDGEMPEVRNQLDKKISPSG